MLILSKYHARICTRRSPEGHWSYRLYDTSRNGTWLNGRRVEGGAELGDEAIIGLAGDSVVFQFSRFERPTLDAAPVADRPAG